MADDKQMSLTDPFTLSSYVLRQQHLTAPDAEGHLTLLLNAITVGCKFVASAVRRAGVAGSDILGKAGTSNVQGEDQKKLDIIANDVFKNVLKKSGQCSILVTEEEDDPIVIEEEYRGGYAVVFDPLDGSSNIECGVSIGTIFGIYHTGTNKTPDELLKGILKPGKDMVAAGYCMYGSMTYMMITTGKGVAGFTLDPSLGEFVLTHPAVRMPTKGNIYSINEGNCANWDEPTKQFVRECQDPGADGKSAYSLRYVGSMVADVHRTLLYGGVFMYPADKKNPSGKLRQLYEVYPMAMLVEQAGGRSIDGHMASLEVLPKHIHDRAPIYLGSKDDIDRIEALYKASRA